MWRGAKNFGGTIADALLHLKAQLAAMTAERDEAIKTVSSLVNSLGDALTKLAASEAARGEMQQLAKRVKETQGTYHHVRAVADLCAALAEPRKAGEP